MEIQPISYTPQGKAPEKKETRSPPLRTALRRSEKEEVDEGLEKLLQSLEETTT